MNVCLILLVLFVEVVHTSHMFVPVGVAGERFRALCALVRPGAGVYVEVLLEHGGLHEALVAYGALVCAEVGVGLGVLHETTA